jgi:centrosomal protein CEP76
MAREYIWKEEYEFRKIKNDILPYKTIDCIFNKKNVYINLQNPDPVRISFDIYDNKLWYNVLRDKDKDGKEIIWKNDIPTFYSFRNFASPYSDDEIDLMKKQILRYVNDTIKNVRMLKNMSTKMKRVVSFY